MPESETKSPILGCQELDKFGCHGQLIFDFFEEVELEESPSSSSSCASNSTIDFNGTSESVDRVEEEEEEEDSEEQNAAKAEAAKAFWDSREELLLATLLRTTSLESNIRQATKKALKELNSIGVNCVCRRRVDDGCRKCTRKEVCHRLQNAGFNCTICNSKWRSSPEIPAGEHEHMEVVQTSSSKKGEVKVIIELNFQAEFVMARACEGYNRLINRLPEVFVGKIERLRSLIKILCSASKKCMKEKKMHMAPRRKQKYMQAKWLGKPQLQLQAAKIAMDLDRKPLKPRASMLTFDLLDNLQGLHHATMIKVV